MTTIPTVHLQPTSMPGERARCPVGTEVGALVKLAATTTYRVVGRIVRSQDDHVLAELHRTARRPDTSPRQASRRGEPVDGPQTPAEWRRAHGRADADDLSRSMDDDLR